MNEHSIIKKALYVLICLLLFNAKMHAQHHDYAATDSLPEILRKADSVWIVQHRSLIYLSTEDDKKKYLWKSLLSDGKPNEEIFLTRKTLTGSERWELSAIFTERQDSLLELSSACYDPHHAVFFFSAGQVSYIDICFECLVITTSPEVRMTMLTEERSWRKLKGWFQRMGMESNKIWKRPYD